METKINPNQINSTSFKFINAVTTGTLTRNGGKFSNFSIDNYLTLGEKTNILSFDAPSTNMIIKDTTALSQADDWEFVMKFKTPDNFVKTGYQYYGWTLWDEEENKWQQYISSNKKFQTYIDGTGISGNTIFIENTIYYSKIVYSYSQSTYKIYLSTTGEFSGEETLESTFNTQAKIPNTYPIIFGRQSGDYRYAYSTTVGYLDIGESYIKINGEYWWKGVETL